MNREGLVERLLLHDFYKADAHWEVDPDEAENLADQAADEIERLREALTQVRNTTHRATGFSDLSARRAAFRVSEAALLPPEGGEAMSALKPAGLKERVTDHAITPDGECTALWACREPGFFGSIKQIVNCARCGDSIRGGPHEPRHFRDALKPTMHVLCDPCYEALPQ